MRQSFALVLFAIVAVQARPQAKKVAHSHKHHTELEEAISVKVKDTNKLPGIATEVEWTGNSAKEYNIYVGTFSDRPSWKLVDSNLLLQNHPSTEPASDVTIRKAFKLSAPAKEVIVCEAETVEEGATPVCGSAEIFDDYDKNVWWESTTAVRIPFLKAGALYSGGQFEASCATTFRGVLHTTETTGFTPSTSQYYGHSSAPHFTVHYNAKTSVATTYQHLPIDVAARALRNEGGGVETNKHCAIQIEIATRAATSSQMPAAQKAELKSLIAWISSKKDIPLESAQYFDANNVKRFPNEFWNTFKGWCGHQHVPENTHWDPGLIGAGPTTGSDTKAGTLYTDFGLEVKYCHDGTNWGACHWGASLEQDLDE